MDKSFWPAGAKKAVLDGYATYTNSKESTELDSVEKDDVSTEILKQQWEHMVKTVNPETFPKELLSLIFSAYKDYMDSQELTPDQIEKQWEDLINVDTSSFPTIVREIILTENGAYTQSNRFEEELKYLRSFSVPSPELLAQQWKNLGKIADNLENWSKEVRNKLIEANKAYKGSLKQEQELQLVDVVDEENENQSN